MPLLSVCLFFIFDFISIFTNYHFLAYAYRPQSPIYSPIEEEALTSFTTEGEFRTLNGISLTDPRSFSDGVWLDPDRSEGEYCAVPLHGTEEAAEISKNIGPLPSPSEVSFIFFSK